MTTASFVEARHSVVRRNFLRFLDTTTGRLPPKAPMVPLLVFKPPIVHNLNIYYGKATELPPWANGPQTWRHRQSVALEALGQLAYS